MNGRLKTRALVAEDDYLVCEEVIRSLKQSGYEVVGDASDGKEAVELTRKLKPHLSPRYTRTGGSTVTRTPGTTTNYTRTSI